MRIKGRAGVSDTAVGLCHSSPEQEEVDEAFYKQLEVASQSQPLALVGDFNHPDVCWVSNSARHVQSEQFLQCV